MSRLKVDHDSRIITTVIMSRNQDDDYDVDVRARIMTKSFI